MKVPAPPPDVDALLREAIANGRLQQIFDHMAAGLSNEYLSWDKLRYKTPPSDLSSEEWWLALKLVRRGAGRTLPLLADVDGRSFSFTLPDAVLQSIEGINRDASGAITISGQVTNPATRDRYVVNSLIEEAITSSQLEGAATSRRVAKDMIRSGRPPRNRSERMILNNYRAMQRIVHLREENLTPDLICEIHRIVTDGTLDDPKAAGRIQDDDADRIAVWGDDDQLLHRPPAVSQLPARMERLCEFANGRDQGAYVPPVLRSLAVHFMLGYDHYFEDGNGRTARAVFYWSMLHQGYWLAEFLTVSRILRKAPAQYARSFLLTEQDDGDLTHFFVYHLGVLERSIRDLHTYLGRKAEELREMQRTISAMPGQFNHRELALLKHAVGTPGSEFTVVSHSSSHDVSGETARQDLKHLEALGLLSRGKVGKGFVWTAVPDLSGRLTEVR